MGAATVSWVTFDEAPVYLALTMMEGGVISGYYAIGSATMDNPPASKITSDRTMLRTGRWMKNRTTRQVPAVFWGTGLQTRPGCTFCTPSTITVSPPLRPEVTM